MMNPILIQDMKQFCSTLDSKIVKRLSIDVLLRLIDKVKDIEDAEIDALLSELYHILTTNISEQITTHTYKKRFNALQKKLVKDYQFYQRGSLQKQYHNLGITLGVAFGLIVAYSNPTMFVVGIGVGLAIGCGIGTQKEQKAAKENRLY